MTTTYSHGIITYGSATINLPSITGNLAITNNNVPIGTIMAYAGNTTEPVGWLFCDGSGKDKTNSVYTALFNVIGYTYGGSGNIFNLPKMISGTTSYGIFPAGSATIANTGFNIDGQLKISNIDVNTDQKIKATQIPVHNHSIPEHNHSIPAHNHSIPAHNHSIPEHNHSIPAHNHSITYAPSTYINTITTDTDTNAYQGSVDGISNIIGTSATLNSSLNNASPNSGNASPNSGNTSATTGDSSVTNSGDSSVTTTGNTPLIQTDYVPNYTAFLWVIKYN